MLISWWDITNPEDGNKVAICTECYGKMDQELLDQVEVTLMEVEDNTLDTELYCEADCGRLIAKPEEV